MNPRIQRKIKDIEEYLTELESILPSTFEEYNSIICKAACERYFEKIIDAATDAVFLLIKEKGLEVPQDDKQAFEILKKHDILTAVLCKRLQNAKSMRNLIVHAYGTVDDKMVFEAITQELPADASAFLKAVKKSMK